MSQDCPGGFCVLLGGDGTIAGGATFQCAMATGIFCGADQVGYQLIVGMNRVPV
jgi:hypothetical protein